MTLWRGLYLENSTANYHLKCSFPRKVLVIVPDKPGLHVASRWSRPRATVAGGCMLHGGAAGRTSCAMCWRTPASRTAVVSAFIGTAFAH